VLLYCCRDDFAAGLLDRGERRSDIRDADELRELPSPADFIAAQLHKFPMCIGILAGGERFAMLMGVVGKPRVRRAQANCSVFGLIRPSVATAPPAAD
jgi:hypothetical protein